MADWTEQIIAEFRARAGRVGGMFEGADLLLLTTTGARTGARRTTPLVYARDGGRLLVFASNAGADRHPGWYHNLLAHPRVEVEIGEGDAGGGGDGDGDADAGGDAGGGGDGDAGGGDGDAGGGVRTLAARAQPLTGEERDAAYARQSERVPAYGEYAARTGRVIPVVALHPLDLAVPDAARNQAIARQLLTVHTTLRGQLAELRDGARAVGGTADGEPATGGELAVHCLAFCDALGSHHATEDAVLPAFDAAFPHLAPVLTRLRAEHREVARALAELRPLLAAPGGAADPAVAKRLEALGAEMERHFAYEEQHLLPALMTP